MTDTLAADALMRHVRALADDIGPRPAGHEEEAQARDYIRRALAEVGIADVEEQPFSTWDTWGYSFCVPTALLLAGNAVGMAGRAGKLLGGIAALAGSGKTRGRTTVRSSSGSAPDSSCDRATTAAVTGLACRVRFCSLAN